MPYTCYSNGSPVASNSSITVNDICSNNFNKSIAPPSPVQHHQEQHIKLSPGMYSLSPVQSQSLPLYASSLTSAKTKVESFFDEDDSDDMQPLDLSIRPNKDEHILKQAHEDEHKPICMVKSCKCHLDNPQAFHLSPYTITGQGATRSPNPGTILSPRNQTDSPLYTQHLTPNSAYHSDFSSSVASSLYLPQSVASSLYLPHIASWTTTESSAFQHLTTSNNVLNGVHNSPNLFRPYDDHIERDVHLSSHDKAQQQGSPISLSNQNNIDDVSDDADGPTYMDLDSTTTKPLESKCRKDNTENFLNGSLSISHISSTQNAGTRSKMAAVFSSPQSTLLQALNSEKGYYSSETRNATCFVGGVISHTSLDKNKTRVPYHTSVSPSSEQAAHPQQHSQQQLHLPNSPSPPTSVSISTTHAARYSLQSNTPPASTYHTQHSEGHMDVPVFSLAPVIERQSSSPSDNHFHLGQPSQKSPSEKDNISGNKSKNIRSTSSTAAIYLQLPVSTSSTNRIIENKHRRAGARRDTGSVHQPTSEYKGDENSTKISLLDFWISKILMERSSDTPQPNKPCRVDYICTANGEKKIRLRLVDLMELQVEHSLKA